MYDPFVALVGVGLLAPVVAGPAVAYGLERVREEWRRKAEWLLIGGALVVAVLADLLWDGPVGGGYAYVLAALPGFLAFLAWRTLLASTLVSLVPFYFVIAILTRSRSTYAPEIALDLKISALGVLDVHTRQGRVEKSQWGSNRARELLKGIGLELLWPPALARVARGRVLLAHAVAWCRHRAARSAAP